MEDCQSIRRKLYSYYGFEKVICCVGNGELAYNISNEKVDNAIMAVYMHEGYRIAVTWNLKRRRDFKREVKLLSLSKTWEDFDIEQGKIVAEYKRMGTDLGAPYEKVLVMDIGTLDTILEELYVMLKVNPYDIEFPAEINNSLEEYDLPEEEIRKKVSTDRWERNRLFRKSVLNAYGKMCAICRCSEEKILEAAHIKAVSDGGNDKPINGVCLCANHHLMFDKKLITIDFNNSRIERVEDSVKSMPWYPVFINKYRGKMLTPSYDIDVY